MAEPPPTYEALQQELAAARAELHALRWLLPAARLLLRSRPAPAPAPAPPPDAPQVDAPQLDVPVATPAPDAPAPARRASGVRGIAMAAYRVARPVMRPVAWRSRAFLTGHVMADLLDMRAKLDLLLARTEAPVGQRGLDPAVAAAVERALLTLALESRRG